MKTIELDGHCTQEVFGGLVGVTQQAVSDLAARGVLNPGDSVGQWLHAYCDNLREVAAGRASMTPGGLDLVQERAALAKVQRERVELQNAVTRGEYAPIEILSDVLAEASVAVVSRFDQLDSLISQAVPDLPDAARMAVLNTISSARNEWVRLTASIALPGDQDDSGAEGTDEDD